MVDWKSRVDKFKKASKVGGEVAIGIVTGQEPAARAPKTVYERLGQIESPTKPGLPGTTTTRRTTRAKPTTARKTRR